MHSTMDLPASEARAWIVVLVPSKLLKVSVRLKVNFDAACNTMGSN